MKKAVHKSSNKPKNKIIEHDSKDSIRLNKYISESGYASRREADRLIEAGFVTVDDVVSTLGTQVYPDQVVKVKGEIIKPKRNRVYIMLHKPRGITTTNDPDTKDNIKDYVDYPEMIFPIGRLDKDSTGLILLTNDGDIVNKILRAEYGHEKEYVVTVNKDITDDFIYKMSSGVTIYNQVANKMQKTNKCEVTKLDNRTFKIILTQGLNKQIRRMTNALDYYVKSLKRIRIMHIRLGDLKVGEWRYLNEEELNELNNRINT